MLVWGMVWMWNEGGCGEWVWNGCKEWVYVGVGSGEGRGMSVKCGWVLMW